MLLPCIIYTCTLYSHPILFILLHVDLIREALKLDSEILELAKSLYQQKSLIVMGRGFNFATCLEGALVGMLSVYCIAIRIFKGVQWQPTYLYMHKGRQCSNQVYNCEHHRKLKN